jgi:hypothetical protein
MIQIDFDYLIAGLKARIVINYSIALYLLYNKAYKEFEEWRWLIYQTKDFYELQYFKKLESEGYIKITGNNLPFDLEFRETLTNLVTPINSKINFDEFWDAYPASTRSGRVLRAVNKINPQGKPTHDYEVCKKKYLSKVKSVKLHENIVAIMKARVACNDYEFMNNLETYINQCKWERDIVYLSRKTAQSDFTKEA